MDIDYKLVLNFLEENKERLDREKLYVDPNRPEKLAFSGRFFSAITREWKNFGEPTKFASIEAVLEIFDTVIFLQNDEFASASTLDEMHDHLITLERAPGYLEKIAKLYQNDEVKNQWIVERQDAITKQIQRQVDCLPRSPLEKKVIDSLDIKFISNFFGNQFLSGKKKIDNKDYEGLNITKALLEMRNLVQFIVSCNKDFYKTGKLELLINEFNEFVTFTSKVDFIMTRDNITEVLEGIELLKTETFHRLRQMKVGESLAFPSMYESTLAGHLTLLQITRGKVGYCVQLFNTGEGTNHHLNLDNPSGRHEISACVTYEIPVEKKGFFYNALLPLMIEAQVLPLLPKEWEMQIDKCEYCMEEYYSILEPFLSGIENIQMPFEGRQISGVCVIRALFAFIEANTHLRKELRFDIAYLMIEMLLKYPEKFQEEKVFVSQLFDRILPNLERHLEKSHPRSGVFNVDREKLLEWKSRSDLLYPKMKRKFINSIKNGNGVPSISEMLKNARYLEEYVSVVEELKKLAAVKRKLTPFEQSGLICIVSIYDDDDLKISNDPEISAIILYAAYLLEMQGYSLSEENQKYINGAFSRYFHSKRNIPASIHLENLIAADSLNSWKAYQSVINAPVKTTRDTVELRGVSDVVYQTFNKDTVHELIRRAHQQQNPPSSISRSITRWGSKGEEIGFQIIRRALTSDELGQFRARNYVEMAKYDSYNAPIIHPLYFITDPQVSSKLRELYHGKMQMNEPPEGLEELLNGYFASQNISPAPPVEEVDEQ